MTKVWFITAAGNGIGGAAARTVLKSGGKVQAAGANIEMIQTSLQDVAGENLAVVRLDGRGETRAQDAVRYALKKFERIDVLFNSGGYRRLGIFEALTIRDIEEVVSANLFEVIYAMRAVLSAMRGQGFGHVINLSSLAGLTGLEQCSAYSAATFAVEGLSQAVAREVEPFGIRITTIAVGLTGLGPHEHGDAEDTGGSLNDRGNISMADAIAPTYDLNPHADAEKLSYVLLTISQMKDPPNSSWRMAIPWRCTNLF